MGSFMSKHSHASKMHSKNLIDEMPIDNRAGTKMYEGPKMKSYGPNHKDMGEVGKSKVKHHESMTSTAQKAKHLSQGANMKGYGPKKHHDKTDNRVKTTKGEVGGIKVQFRDNYGGSRGKATNLLDFFKPKEEKKSNTSTRMSG